jgi:alpha-galactosidase
MNFKNYAFKSLLLSCALAISVTSLAQKNPQLAVSPPMGWNSWNWHGKRDINEQIVRETIDAMVEHGLKDAGYVYVVVDGGWRDTKTGPNGELLAHPVKFPSGMKALADYAHSKGLKFGVHVVPGTHDCGGDPVGGFGREELHVKQFVEWGLDFVKLDLCIQKSDPCESCVKTHNGWSEETIKASYLKWSELLHNCGRDILFSISAYWYRDWYPEYCNMARTTFDIMARCNGINKAVFNSEKRENKGFLTVMGVSVINNAAAAAAGNGYWNDPDMAVIGEQGLTPEEQKSHLALWSIMSSPLFLGNDPRNMTPAEKELILNKEIIAINQDPTGQGKIIKEDGNTQVWAKKLSNGKVAVLMLNLDTTGEKEISLNLAEVGLKGKIKARDVINHKDIGTFKKEISLRAGTNQSWFLILGK